MPVTALKPGYTGENLDARENFGPNQLVYLHWEQHLMFCAALAFPLPPEMPFGAVVGELLPQFYAPHPDFEKIDWSAVRWNLDGEDFTPRHGRLAGRQRCRPQVVDPLLDPGARRPG